MQGDLTTGVAPGLLREVYAGRQTGSLRFVRGERRSSLRLFHGQIVRAESNVPELHMGEIMVARGLLAQHDLDRATAILLRERKRLGQILKETSGMDEAQIENGLSLHICEVLADVLNWRDGTYAFEDADAEVFLEEPDRPLKMSTGSMILEAVDLVRDRDAVLFGLGDLDCVLLPSSNALVRFQRISMAPIDAFVLSRVDGTMTVREVLSVTPLPAEAVERSLFALLCVGIIEAAPKQARVSRSSSAQFLRQEILDTYASLSAQNHFTVLGVSPTATPAEIKAAFFRLAKRFHPDVCHDRSLADLQGHIEAIFRRLNEAHETLSNPRECAEYRAAFEPPPKDTEPPRPVVESPRPEDLFLRAKERFDEGKYWEAVALLGETIPLAQRPLKQQARVLLARAYLKKPDGIKPAEKELIECLKENPGDVDAHFLLGTVYKRVGLAARARTMFRKVLELSPRHRHAQAELDLLGS